MQIETLNQIDFPYEVLEPFMRTALLYGVYWYRRYSVALAGGWIQVHNYIYTYQYIHTVVRTLYGVYSLTHSLFLLYPTVSIFILIFIFLSLFLIYEMF